MGRPGFAAFDRQTHPKQRGPGPSPGASRSCAPSAACRSSVSGRPWTAAAARREAARCRNGPLYAAGPPEACRLTIAPTTASPPEAGDSEVVHPPAAPARRSRGIASAVLVAAVVVLLLTVAWLNRWVADDGFINLRVVANMHDGFGPVFNVGERVEVFTSPLWVALLWLFSSVLPGIALEWIAVVAGALAAALGFLAAARGAWFLWSGTGRRGLAVPLGLLLVVAVRPVWDFATSGLETGLTFGWLGVCFWALAALHFAQLKRCARTSTAVSIGLGPLVRPDLPICRAVFLVLLLVLPPAPKRVARLRLP